MNHATSTPAEPQWIGAFSADDRREIAALRLGQARAIEAGDADAYAQLVADDIHLLIPGHDIVAGREHFLERQRQLFRTAKFPPFHKFPLRVERSGDLAVEIGRQELALPPNTTNAGVFSRHQKYTHVFRRTPHGWRFAVLMSNPSAP